MKKRKKIKTSWDFALLYEKGLTDPRIEHDVRICEDACAHFEHTYRENTLYTANEQALYQALSDYEKCIEIQCVHNPLFYLQLVRAQNNQNKKAEAMSVRIQDRLTKASNRIMFFELKLGKIVPEDQKRFLQSERLKPYHYFLERLFITARYALSEAEEKILSLNNQPARELWIDGNEKLLSKQTITWGKGKQKREIPLTEAMATVFNLPLRERRALYALLSERLQAISDFAESEINAVCLNKKISDELRGLPQPYSSRLLHDEMDEAEVNRLVETVTQAFPVAHRFMKIKAKLLGLSHLEYSDRSAGVGKSVKEISFEDGLTIVKKAFGTLDQSFADIIESYLEKGQIDIFPKKGKSGGAFCAGMPPLPTFLLLNHVSDMKSVMTLAHECGHGIHTEYIRKQPPLYRGYSTAVAEVASTFFEEVVFAHVFETLTHKEKIITLHDRINDSISTIFRQIACFNFEKEMHTTLRSKGFIAKEEIASMLNKHMKSYLGPIMKMKEGDGYFFVQWSHIRNFFYVYTYAYGDVVSKALYARYKKDPLFIEKIKQFLSTGGSKSPYDTFKDIGIDTASPSFFKDGIAKIEEDIKVLEQLITTSH